MHIDQNFMTIISILTLDEILFFFAYSIVFVGGNVRESDPINNAI